MKVYVVIAGSREYSDYEELKNFVTESIGVYMKNAEPVILSGGCRGADCLGERLAAERGWEIRRYPPEWEKYGKAAGPIRNKKMVDDCHFAICFWNGKSRGTKNLIRYAEMKQKPVFLKKIT